VAFATLATLLCMAGSAVYALLFYLGDAEVSSGRAVVASLILPIFVGAPIYYLLFRQIRSLTFRNRRLEAKNRRDGLTKCLNQTAFHREVTRILGLPAANRCRAALLIIDADHFKAINDTYGHDTGDEAIKLIAQKLRAVVRRRDPIGRIGGEEFGVLLRDADMRIAQAVAERIRSAVNLSDVPGAAPGARLSVSVGGTVFEDEVTFTEIFKAADNRLYTAKAKGRNRVDIGPLAERRRAA
jgi:diguanylate cyclase (GGDEF)-like protein